MPYWARSVKATIFCIQRIKDENVSQHFSWVNNINYRNCPFDVLELKEFNSTNYGKYTKFVWLTNLKVGSNNFSKIAVKKGLKFFNYDIILLVSY